ncbi:Rib/alpha-like domain-containing protein [Lactobacillus sp. ESL0785]|uniref:Rib/alpha-like domain-containing protein n=1 Tax=Lactobacillus sp. ESL0785 TaxID=2983232 RepID=UPI0023F71EB9|nr:Rib/alpha-like domain-containing protein [Lactobacillus sp. ESL0785]WEV71186.1 Rib/alpha-like domain-containing protein [Lactobacillus sp. ESL0785]
MSSRNNLLERKKSSSDQIVRWSLRRLSTGAASIAVACGFIFGVMQAPQEVSAKTISTTKVGKTKKSKYVVEPKSQLKRKKHLVTTKTNKVVQPKQSQEQGVAEQTETTTNDSNTAVTSGIENVVKQDKYFEVTYKNGQVARLYMLNDKTFRYYIDPDKKYDEPEQSQKGLNAKILADEVDPKGTGGLADTAVTQNNDGWTLANSAISINFDKAAGTMSVAKNGKTVLQEAKQVEVGSGRSSQTLKDDGKTRYYGGGTQNGKFNLDKENVKIANTNNWVDKGVSSPNPFYWSTKGYGVVRYTFKPGNYDFDSEGNGDIITTHNEDRFDAIYFFDDSPYDLIHDYQELTGLPALTPIYGFYEAHLNAYNRDYWVKMPKGTSGAIKYPDGNYYVEYQPSALPSDKKDSAIRETLNGDKGENDPSYQFSARAVIDQYLKHDMPLGWFLPNDGYGAGYGQTDTLAGNLENLKNFIEYANSKGIQVGLWTQQNLSPADPNNPKPSDRDFEKEVENGVVALKTDVAWVGNGYSFGLNATQTAANMIKNIKGDTLRPFIISLDGWAGTQNTAAVWTGDETGGDWEYIRFQIPTYIGEGLSGQPNSASDMDGIFGGNNPIINAREYEWKAFTPIQLNMDGWGYNPKNPYAFDDTNPEVTKINRAYLKQKTMLMPYIYTMAHDATASGKPMVRAMFLDYPDIPEAYTDLVKYQYMWGDNFLVAPIYQNTKMAANGDDIRNGIYLPDKNQIWIDYYTGKEYQGGQVINNYTAPLWKLPLFVKAGAIVPTAAATNTPKDYLAGRNARQFEIYPSGTTEASVYEDDGISAQYKSDKSAETEVKSSLDGDKLTVTVSPTKGSYDGIDTKRTTEFNIRTKKAPSEVKATVGGKEVTLREATDLADYEKSSNVYYYDDAYLTNPYLKEVGSGLEQSFLRVKLGQTDVRQNGIELRISGVDETPNISNGIPGESTEVKVPANIVEDKTTTTPTTVGIKWDSVDGAKSYNIKADDVIYTGIPDTSFVLKELKPNTTHTFQVQTVTATGVSPWSEEQSFSSAEDPLKDAVKITYQSTTTDIGTTDKDIWQSGCPVKNLFDQDLSTLAHTNWYPPTGKNVTPITISTKLDGITDLDKLVYVPRDNGGNGNISAIEVSTSIDGLHWNKITASASGWQWDNTKKVLKFAPGTKAYYVKFTIPNGATRGNYFSGQELLLYKKPNSVVSVPGDFNNDGVINDNDQTFLLNYIGETKYADNDFTGYVENADLNQNGRIDAFDINYTMSKLGGGAHFASDGYVIPSGNMTIKTDKSKYKKGDTITVTVLGNKLSHVNALSARLPYDKDELSFESITSGDLTNGMVSFAKDKTHSDGNSDVNVVYSNKGEAPRINIGNNFGIIATIQFKALKPINCHSISFKLDQQLLANQFALEYEPEDSNTVSVEVNSETDAETNTPSGRDVTVKVNEKLPDADSAIINAKDLPAGTKYNWSKEPDVSKVGDTTGEVTITYPDGSTTKVTVVVHVKAAPTDAETNTPSGRDVTVKVNEKLPDADSAIINAKDLPAGTKYNWSKEPDVSKVGDTTGEVTITYPDGSTTKVTVVVHVKAAPTDAETNTPSGRDVTVKVNEKLPDADSAIINAKDLPAGTKYNWSKEPDVSKVGDTTGEVTITYPDGSTTKVTVVVHVKAAPTDAETNTPSGRDVTVKVNEKLPDADSAIINAKDLPAGTKYNWSKEPDVSKVGDTTGEVTITYPDGSTTKVTVVVHVKAAPTDAETNTPNGRDVTVKVNEKLPDADSAIINAKDLPAGTKYNWSKVPDVSKVGDTTGEITITYPDGSTTKVTVVVHVKAVPGNEVISVPSNNLPSNVNSDKDKNNLPDKDKQVTKKKIMHNVYLYDGNGKRITGQPVLKVGTIIEIQGIKTINAQKFYDLGNGTYVAAGNIDGKLRKLKHNSFIYNKRGKKVGHKILRRKKQIITYGSSVTIKGKKYYIIDKNRFVKANNFS